MSDTLWESVCKNVAYKLLGVLPGYIRNGYSGHGVTFPPYTDVALPALDQYTENETVTGYCGVGFDDVGEPSLTLSANVLNGLDSIARYGQASFTEQDVTMVVPVILGSAVATGRYSVTQDCQPRGGGGSATPVTTTGGYTATFAEVQIDVTIGLDPNAGVVTSVSLVISDLNQQWSQQPSVTLTFDGQVPVMRQVVLRGVIIGSQSKLQESVAGVITGKDVAQRIQTLLNDLLQSA